MAVYRAEKWTDVYGPNGHHEMWAVISDSNEPVAFGGEQFAKETANDYNVRFASVPAGGN